MNYRFQIEGIDCGNCAAKIEALINKESEIKEARIQFVTKKVEVTTHEPIEMEKVQAIIQKAADRIEDGVKVTPLQKRVMTASEGVKSVQQEHSACGCGCSTSNHYEEEKVEHIHHHEEGCNCAAHNFEITLEPEEINDDEKKKDHLLWTRLGLSVGLLIIGSIIKVDLLIVVSYFIIAYDVLWRAVKNIKHGKVFDENFLMAVATIAAFCIGDFPEAVAVILFYQVGEYFQGKAVAKSRRAISSLMSIKPESARVMRDGVWVEVLPEEVAIGERIQVRPGEKVPLDSIIVKGESTLDTSMLTGESVPAFVKVGDQVLSATVNLDTMLELEVTHTLQESTVSKVLEMIEHASGRKTTAEQFITRFAAWYTPTVVIGALLLAIIPPLFSGNWYHWIYTSIVFLVISCPCALVVSVPLSFFGGIGAASKQGILVKGSNFLEVLSTIDTVVLDKTGTITKGKFEVTAVRPATDCSKEILLSVAKRVESHSNHPIARAIASYEVVQTPEPLESFSEQAGFGITAQMENEIVLAGNYKLMKRENIICEEVKEIGTWVYVAKNGNYLGVIGVADTIKSDTEEAIKRMKARGIKRVVMLTGDKKDIAESIGQAVGIDQVYSELLPQDKVEKVEGFINEGSKVAFVGDGINDAPALTLAHVGIAMGGIGSDAAVEASDVVIMTDSLVKVSSGMDIAKQTKRIVTQNIVLALGVKLIVMILGIFGFANMWLAVFSDVGVAIIAILNAIRLLRIKEN